MTLPETPPPPDDRGRWFDRTGRTRLEIAGPDRAKFLHNLVTHDVKRLPEGAGREAFVTTLQGKILAYVTLLATDRAILLRTEPESLEGLLPHLRKYGVFDDVEIVDASSRTFEYHLVGPGAAGALVGSGDLPGGPLDHAEVDVAGHRVRVVRESTTGPPGVTLIGPAEAAGAVRDLLNGAGLAAGDPAAFEAARIEAGTPASGRDVTIANLPQEVGRDAQAISFVKGCYLGQETVARLDALGHVNKLLRGLRVEGSAVPPVGSAITAEGKAVGSVTSSAWSETWGTPVALGYVRVAQAEAGSRVEVESEGGPAGATVVDLPMVGPSEG